MPKKNTTVPRVTERLRIAYLMVDLTREVHRALYGGDGNFAANVDGVFVALAVLIGHSEGRPMSATKIAHYLGMSRTTAQRKLQQLEELGIIERNGTLYSVTSIKMTADHDLITRLVALITTARP